MALVVSELAREINKAISASSAEGLPIDVTPEMETYARAIITTFHSASTVHLPGTVTGTTAPGAPLSAGAAANGTLVAFLPATWLGEMTAGFPTADPGQLSKEAIASTGYISSTAKINFEAGKITGNCTNTPVAPGPLVAGAGTDGTVDELVGDDWAKVVVPPLGNPALAAKIYKAIVKYINEKAEVSYLAGSVTGVCPPAGGPLSAGAATGGVID